MTTEQREKWNGTFSFWMSVWFFGMGMGGVIAMLHHLLQISGTI